ncbi:MAG: type III pantothenate kinase, partial [Clostridia bacterium]|nr:type III pantothenate kinase [Clostridia bacterium]
KTAVKKLTGTDAMVIGPGIKTGLSIKTDNPAQLGSDLVVDAVAGISEYGAPLIIFDLGTATTISVINKNREYLGGMIMPGMMISLNAMVSRTSQLPKISLDPPKKLIGTNTIDCMKSGILYGTAASMDGMIDRIREEMGEVTVIATGGLAGTIVPLCKNKVIHDDELLIKGLMLIYNKNI